MKRTHAALIPFLLVSLLVFLIGNASVFGNEDAKAAEIRMGREAQKEIEKERKLVTDPQVVERVQQIGQAIVEVANSTPVEAKYGRSEIYQFDYQFKVLEDKSVNAFSLPGGFIYVNSGLLDYVQSDHELAGVLAHEVAHASHHHMVHLLKEESKLDNRIALLLLAGMLAKVDSRDLSNLMVGAQLIRIAKSSGYGQKAEADADASAVTYMLKAGYNPVGVLTFLERLARDYSGTPNLDLGILQTHPAPKDRCKAVMDKIKSLNLPINRREVTNPLKATIEPTIVNGQTITQVKLGDKVLFEPAPLEGILTSQQRAQVVATKINQFLDSEPVLREVTVGSDGTTVMACGEPILVVTTQDGSLHGKPESEVAACAADELRRVIWREMLDRVY